MHKIYQTLTNSKYYIEIIDKYINPLLNKSIYYSHLSFLQNNKHNLSITLAQSIAKNKFYFEKNDAIYTPKKSFKTNIINIIMLKAMLKVISPQAKKEASRFLYSAIEGKTVYKLITNFTNYLRKNKHNCLWIYKTDITHFYNSIPIHNNSVLWTMLDQLFVSIDSEFIISQYIRNLYVSAITTDYIRTEDKNRRYGILTCSPLSNLLSNLYLSSIDKVFTDYDDKNLFYARYVDDIVITHANKDVMLNHINLIKNRLSVLELKVNVKKEQYIYYTRCGKANLEDNVFIGSSVFHYLGATIYADGRTHSSKRRVHIFMRGCYKLIQSQKKIIKDLPTNLAGTKISQILTQECLQVDNLKYNVNLKHILIITNNDIFLKQLDLQIALWFAEILTNIKGKCAFRKISYSTIRNTYNLPSLINLKSRLYKNILKTS